MALAHELANEEKAASPSRLLSALLLKVLLSGRVRLSIYKVKYKNLTKCYNRSKKAMPLRTNVG